MLRPLLQRTLLVNTAEVLAAAVRYIAIMLVFIVLLVTDHRLAGPMIHEHLTDSAAAGGPVRGRCAPRGD